VDLRSSKASVSFRNYASVGDSLRATVKLIGQGIRSGSLYYPLRQHAARLAATAPPKDYERQIAAIYEAFVKQWRYVRDPASAESVVIGGPQIWEQIWGAGRPNRKGWGDCDDAAVAMGAALSAIGIPLRIVTIAGPTTRSPLGHVYVEAQPPPNRAWIAIDPVGHPKHGFKWRPPEQRRATWDLDGTLISRTGNWTPALSAGLFGDEKKESTAMSNFRNYGLENFGLAGADADPASLVAWNEYGPVAGFGAYSGVLGIVNDASHILAEYDKTDEVAPGYVRTKMLEISPTDYQMVQQTGRPRLGCVALGDDGDVYQYQLGGFFKKIFSKVKSGFRKIKKGVKGLIAKLPGGKYLIKLYDRVHSIAMKIVRPLAKIVGKYASKLAPIAALIPGYGPAIAGALFMAGKIANVMNKVGVTVDKLGKPIFKSGTQAKQFRRALAKEAHAEKQKRKAPKARTPVVFGPSPGYRPPVAVGY